MSGQSISSDHGDVLDALARKPGRDRRELAAAFGLDHGGKELSWEQFKEDICGPGMREFFHSINIDMTSAREIFELLDADGSQTLSLKEVIDGCTLLRGTARVIDIAVMMQNQRAMNDFMIQEIDRVKSLLKDKRRSKYSFGSARSNLSEEA